jgi:hypothetical protein
MIPSSPEEGSRAAMGKPARAPWAEEQHSEVEICTRPRSQALKDTEAPNACFDR